MALLDSTMYGGENGDVQLPDPMQVGSGVQPDTRPAVPVAEVFKGTAAEAEGKQVNLAADRVRASMLESAGAATALSTTKRIIDAFNMPPDVPEEGYKFSEFIKEIPLQLDKDEFAYMQGARSNAGASARLEYIQSLRKARQAAGDNMLVAMGAGLFDPIDFVTTPGILKAGRALRVGRAGTAVAAGTAAAGTVALGEGPLSTSDMLLNFLGNAAAAGVAYKPGRGLVKDDPDFPDVRLQDTVSSMDEPVVQGKPKVRMVSPEEWVEDITPAKPAQYDFVPEATPREVSGSKPNYGYRGDNFQLTFDNDLDKAAYIVAGKGKSKAHDAILSWATAVSGKSADEIIAAGNTIRDDLKARFKATGAGDGTLFGRDAVSIPKVFDLKPKVRRVQVSPEVPEQRVRRKVKDAVWEEVPQELTQPHLHTPEAVADAVEAHVDATVKKYDGWLGWNMAKTMRSAGPVGEEVSRVLFDKVEPERIAVRSELSALQQKFHDELLSVMADEGHGLLSRINPLTARKAAQAQHALEQEVRVELYRREMAARQGRSVVDPNVPERVRRIADALDEVHAKPVHELKAAGVLGAEDLAVTPGWHHRVINSANIEDMQRRIQSLGLTAKQAHQAVVRLFATSYRKVNGLSNDMAYDIAAATVNRALRKGYFEDIAYSTQAGAGEMKLMRDMLRDGGLSGERLERVMQFFQGKADEAGKAGFLKHRMEMDYKATAVINGQTFRVIDLLDGNLSTIVDQYLDGVSAQVAFARSGLRSASDVEALREKLLHSIQDSTKREQIKDLFDNVVASLRGLPTGEKVNQGMRLMGEYNRLITLANSGIWQFTEYASIMSEYGMLATLKHALKEAPGFRGLMSDIAKDTHLSRELKDILTNHSEKNLRLRPFLTRFEDNFVFDTGNTAHMLAQQAGQLIPYVNGMKYIHSHQARIIANLILDRLAKASAGDIKAQQALQKYGIELPSMEKLKKAFSEHGSKVDDWPTGVWESVRPAFASMMDESVLHTRMKDMPAFAMFDKVGKFMFMYRSFVLTAHNKLLVGRADRDGLGAVGLLMLYQYPLSALAVQAQNTIQGKKELTDKELATKAVQQMGALGLGSDLFGIVTGAKSAGSLPGLIPIDRAGRTVSAAVQGDTGDMMGNGLQLLPLIGAIPAVPGLARLAKED